MKDTRSTILKIILAVAMVSLFSVFYFVFTLFNEGNSSQKPVITNTINENTVGIPKHISIPLINVEADIESAGLDAKGNVAVPDGPDGVTWYKFGAKPGERGSAVVTGHYGPWLSGADSVFDDLGKLQAGDKIYVKDHLGNTYTFKVFDKKTYGLDEVVPEVFNRDDKIYLNVITCSGQWLKNQKTFANRLVVFTELVN